MCGFLIPPVPLILEKNLNIKSIGMKELKNT